MPRLWTENIATHRRQVHDAVLDAAVELVNAKGVANLTMADLANASQIGRATLYKYFPSLDAVLAACHHREVERHLAELQRLAVGQPPATRLAEVLRGYARRIQGSRANHAAAGLVADDHAARGRDAVVVFIEELIADAAAERMVRTDISPGELAIYCVHALDAAGASPSRAGADRIARLVIESIGLPTTV